MANELLEVEEEGLTGTYKALQDTLDTDALVALREPILQSVDYSGSRGRRTGTLDRLRNNKVYGALAGRSDATPQYIKDDAREDLIARARLKISRGAESTPVRVLALLTVAADVLLVAIQLGLKDNPPVMVEELIEVLTLIFSAFFCAEVALRIIGQGMVFFKRWFEVLDMCVILISSVLTVSFILLQNDSAVDSNSSTIVLTARLFVLLRLVRVVFWAKIFSEQKGVQRFIRTKVSQNKRRYTGEGYDLDLTYVTDRVIAMSFPSSGGATFYRNSISEVSQFLDSKHSGHYRVYNLCSEKEYDPSHFHHQVHRVLIDDHNVPKFTDLVDFCEDAQSWMLEDPGNVIAVHCKGGKGRTGMMVAAVLMRSGLFPQAQQSLAYFRERRTDRSRGTKNQGVDTPSQNRYVSYYELLLTEMGGELPPARTMKLTKLIISGIGQDREWRFEVFLMRQKIFQSSITTSPDDEMTSVILDADCAVVIINSSRQPVLVDDVKLKFHCNSKSVPTGSDKCQFYFWFHTTFIQDNRLLLRRSDIDNMQKSRVRRSYPSSFSVELQFEQWNGELFTEEDFELVD